MGSSPCRAPWCRQPAVRAVPLLVAVIPSQPWCDWIPRPWVRGIYGALSARKASGRNQERGSLPGLLYHLRLNEHDLTCAGFAAARSIRARTTRIRTHAASRSLPEERREWADCPRRRESARATLVDAGSRGRCPIGAWRGWLPRIGILTGVPGTDCSPAQKNSPSWVPRSDGLSFHPLALELRPALEVQFHRMTPAQESSVGPNERLKRQCALRPRRALRHG
jgi:hypothetical protein